MSLRASRRGNRARLAAKHLLRVEAAAVHRKAGDVLAGALALERELCVVIVVLDLKKLDDALVRCQHAHLAVELSARLRERVFHIFECASLKRRVAAFQKRLVALFRRGGVDHPLGHRLRQELRLARMQRRGDRCVVRIPILLHPIPSLFREEELCRAALGLLARKGEKRFKRAVHVAFFTYKHEARADICRFARKRIVRVQLLVRSLDERFAHLIAVLCAQGDFLAAVRDQLTLYPEYLLPALWPEQDKRGRHTLLRLAALALAFDVGMHLILELFYGAAMPLRIDPVHAAARCGALSIFNRLEWLQFILWVMAVTVKLALYLYALVRLLGGQNKAEDSAAGLDWFPLYPGGVWLLCAVLRKLDLDAALSLRNVLTWSFVGLTGIGGAAACLYRRLRRC